MVNTDSSDGLSSPATDAVAAADSSDPDDCHAVASSSSEETSRLKNLSSTQAEMLLEQAIAAQRQLEVRIAELRAAVTQ